MQLLPTQDCDGSSTAIVGVERNNGIVLMLSGAGPIASIFLRARSV